MFAVVGSSARFRAETLLFGADAAMIAHMAHGNVVHDGTGESETTGPHDDLVDHLVRTTQLPAGIARRVVDDVVAYFAEPVEAVIRRRHRELHASGLANTAIYDRIAAELAARPVAAPSLTSRQIRRVIYG